MIYSNFLCLFTTLIYIVMNFLSFTVFNFSFVYVLFLKFKSKHSGKKIGWKFKRI